MQIRIDPSGRLYTKDHPRAARKPKKCFKCGSRRIAKILYGLTVFDDKQRRDLRAGKIVAGGCIITDDDPSWQCVECGQQVWRALPDSLRGT